MTSNANSTAAKYEQPPSLGVPREQEDSRAPEKKGWRERRRRSEWVFRPLRVKFKVKELENLYNNSVFRQKQSLLLSACVVMVFLSVLVILTYLGEQKVSLLSHTDDHTHTWKSSGTSLYYYSLQAENW